MATVHSNMQDSGVFANADNIVSIHSSLRRRSSPLSSISIMTIAITISVRAKLVRFQNGLEDVSASRLPILLGGLIRDELPVSGRPRFGVEAAAASDAHFPKVHPNGPPSIHPQTSILTSSTTITITITIIIAITMSVRAKVVQFRGCFGLEAVSASAPSSLPSPSPLPSPSSSPSCFHILPHHHSDDVQAQR